MAQEYGSPWLIGKHPRQAHSTDKDRLTDSLEAMLGSTIAVIPEDSSVEIKEMVDTVAAEKIARGQMKYVGVLSQSVIEKLTTLNKAPQSAVIAVRDKDVLHGLREIKQNANIALPLEFWENLPEKLRHPKAILLQAKETFENPEKNLDTLLFVYDTDKGKVAIKMGYEVKLKDRLSGKKLPYKLNMVTTGSLFKDKTALYDFDLIWGKFRLTHKFA